MSSRGFGTLHIPSAPTQSPKGHHVTIIVSKKILSSLSKNFGNISLLGVEKHMWQFLVTANYLKKSYGKT